MDAASNSSNLCHLFRLVRLATGKRYSPEPIVRNSEGQIISDTKGKLSRWVENFSNLLNNPLHTTAPISALTQSGYEADCSPSYPKEIADILRRLNPKKTAGAEGIPAEIHKGCIAALLDHLQALFCSIWETEICPSSWDTSVLLTFPKKGDGTLCSIVGQASSMWLQKPSHKPRFPVWSMRATCELAITKVTY
ncbi:unnamed protein product, partial [Dicrocoelium dendriticum]